MMKKEKTLWFIIFLIFGAIAIFNPQASEVHADMQDGNGTVISLEKKNYVLKPGESITITLASLSEENISASIIGENGSIMGNGVVEERGGIYNITFSTPKEEGTFIISIKVGVETWKMPIIITNNTSGFNDTFNINGLNDTEICFLILDPNGNTTEKVNFIAPDMKGAAYKWNFGDGSDGNGQNVSHTYATPGLYTVSVNISWIGGYKIFKRPVVVSSYNLGEGFTSDGDNETNVVPDSRDNNNKDAGGGTDISLGIMMTILVLVMTIITILLVIILRRRRKNEESYWDMEDEEFWDEEEDD